MYQAYPMGIWMGYLREPRVGRRELLFTNVTRPAFYYIPMTEITHGFDKPVPVSLFLPNDLPLTVKRLPCRCPYRCRS